MAAAPFDLVKYFVRQRFGVPNSSYRLGYHPGTDYATPTGIPVRAEVDGYVTWVWSTTYGYVAALIMANGDVLWHAHNSAKGVTGSVKKGTIIAYTGNTGWTTGPHSHIEYRLGGNQNYPIDFDRWLRANLETTPAPGMPRVGSSIRVTIPRTVYRAGTVTAIGTLPPDVRVVRGYDPKFPNRILVNSSSLGNGIALALYYQSGARIEGWTQI